MITLMREREREREFWLYIIITFKRKLVLMYNMKERNCMIVIGVGEVQWAHLPPVNAEGADHMMLRKKNVM